MDSQPRLRWLQAFSLFLLTFLTTTSYGTGFLLSTRTNVVTDLVADPVWLMVGEPVQFFRSILQIPWAVWTTPRLLLTGLSFSIPLLIILLAHELGHYLACRRHGIPCTLPLFLPAPLLIGTFGAFIRIRARIPSRRELLNVGASGPLAGFVVLLPFLAYGIAMSQVGRVVEIDPDLGGGWLLVPGMSLIGKLLIYLFHGPLEPGMVLNHHPFSLAAWVGIFVTCLNLVPVGQLDGGHILYAVSPVWSRRLRPVVLVVVAALGFFWPGWWLWCGILLLVGRRHPAVSRPAEPLDKRRRIIALIALAILVVVFMPNPISVLVILI